MININIPVPRLVEVIRRAESGHPLLKLREHLDSSTASARLQINDKVLLRIAKITPLWQGA